MSLPIILRWFEFFAVADIVIVLAYLLLHRAYTLFWKPRTAVHKRRRFALTLAYESEPHKPLHDESDDAPAKPLRSP